MIGKGDIRRKGSYQRNNWKVVLEEIKLLVLLKWLPIENHLNRRQSSLQFAGEAVRKAVGGPGTEDKDRLCNSTLVTSEGGKQYFEAQILGR